MLGVFLFVGLVVVLGLWFFGGFFWFVFFFIFSVAFSAFGGIFQHFGAI